MEESLSVYFYWSTHSRNENSNEACIEKIIKELSIRLWHKMSLKVVILILSMRSIWIIYKILVCFTSLKAVLSNITFSDKESVLYLFNGSL